MRNALLSAGRCFLFFAVAGYCIQPSLAQSDLQVLLAKGDSAYLSFENELALDYYIQALSADSTDFDTLLKASRTCYDLGLDYIAKARQEEALKQFEASVSHAQALVRLFPERAQSHFLLAATYGNLAIFKGGKEKVLLGRLVEQHSREAIALDTAFAYPYVSLGIYYREVASLNWFERTLAKVFYGRLPEATFEIALEHLHTALRLRPNFPFLHFELAKTFMTLEQFDKAVQHLDILTSLPPETSQDARNQQNAKRMADELRLKIDR